MSDPAVYQGRATVRAGIIVTGTEVLTGIISDRNGPWLSQQLASLGVDTVTIQIVGDRPSEIETALAQMAAEGLRVIVTSGGLGPTADDLTAEVVARFCGRELVLDTELEALIRSIIEPLLARWPHLDPEAVFAANRKQALIPSGATVLAPVGTAPGLVVAPLGAGGGDGVGAGGGDRGQRGPTVVVLPGPPAELKKMWPAAVASEAFAQAIAGAVVRERAMIRMYGIPEAEISDTLRAAADAGIDLSQLEITTCLRRGELEISTRYEPSASAAYAALAAFIDARHADVIFARDGATIDEQVAQLLVDGGLTVATAESCTGGLLAARLTERAGSSAYVLGGAVVYSNEAKTLIVDVPPALIESRGAVSLEVAAALARGARLRYGASVGIGITGIAGPGGGSEEKPVGTVCLSVALGEAGSGGALRTLTRRAYLPGDRALVRDRATTAAMHMLARVLRGEGE